MTADRTAPGAARSHSFDRMSIVSDSPLMTLRHRKDCCEMTAPAERYLEAFRCRTAYCRALLELSSRQQDYIAASDYAGLIELLTHKQQLLDELTNVNHDGSNLWQTWRTERDRLPQAERQACERVLDEADELLKRLLSLEQSSTDLLSDRRDSTQLALAEVNQGGVAMQGYLSPAEATVSRRLDLDL